MSLEVVIVLKTVREIVSARVSSIDENSRVKWRLSDSTMMRCPRAQLRKPTSMYSACPTLLLEKGKTNGNTEQNEDEKSEPIT